MSSQAEVVHCLPETPPCDEDEAIDSLERCLRASFETCWRIGADSIALPAIGREAHGHRVSTVATESVRVATRAQRIAGRPSRVRCVLAGPTTLEAFLHALSTERAARR